jgi:hypothetical protein
MIASNFRPYQKGTLQGFFSLLLGSGLEIHGMTLHEKDGKNWVGFPAKQYEEDGQTKWQALIRIPDEKRWKRFQTLAQEAVAKIRGNGGEGDAGDVPF